MKEQKFSEGFHKFVIWFMLWVCGLGMIGIGIRNMAYAIEDGVSPLPLVIIMQIVLILSGLLVIKARFDLAKMKRIAPKELLAAFLAAAFAFFVDWRIYDVNGELVESTFLFALLSACWGIALYRYYTTYSGRLTD